MRPSASSTPPASTTSTSSSVASIVRSTRRALRWSSTMRIFMFAPACCKRDAVAVEGYGPFGPDHVRRRDAYNESRASLYPYRVDSPAVGADDSLGDREAKPRATRLGREPRRKELRRVALEARPVVPDDEIGTVVVGAPGDADAAARSARVDRVGHEVDEHLGDLVGVAAKRGVARDDDLEAAAPQGVAQEHLGARGEVADGHGLPVDAVPDHAAQPRDEPLEAVDLFAPDVDLFRVERRVGRVAPEDRAEEVDGVAHLVRNLGGDGLDERQPLGLPRRGLLLAAPLELGIAVG